MPAVFETDVGGCIEAPSDEITDEGSAEPMSAPPYQIFRYLVRRDGGPGDDDSSDSVESSYSMTELARKPVVQDEAHGRRYMVFRDRAALWSHIKALPQDERCLHEVVFGKAAQRLKLDIDVPAHKLDAIPNETLRACLGEKKHPTEQELRPPQPADPEIEKLIESILESDDTTATMVIRPPADPLKDERDQKMWAILDFILDRLVDELYMTYYAVEDVVTTRRDLIVAESSGQTTEGYKYSFHVIVAPYAVVDNEEAREFTRFFLEGIPAPIRTLIDPQVNKRTQNFRLALCSKPGASRFKIVGSDTAERLGSMIVSPSETMITAAPGTRMMPRVLTSGETDRRRVDLTRLADADVKSILAIAKQAIEGHALRGVRGSLLLFTREIPSYCGICGETHHRDNTLMLSVEPVEAARTGPWPDREPVLCRIVEHCRHSPGKGKVIGESPLTFGSRSVSRGAARSGAVLAEKERCPRVAARITAIAAGKTNPHDSNSTLFERIPEKRKTLYSEDKMRAYELVPTLAVKAQMKLGKTRALRAYLDKFFPTNGLQASVIRFITFRQTFSNSLKEQFPDFTLYSDQKGDLDHLRFPRLIVQVESLHRLPMASNPEPVDLLVLDEVESILSQFNSGLHKHFNAAFAMFRWLIKTARHVVCMDANLGDRTYRTLERMRPNHPIHFHWNRFSRAAEDTYFFTDKQAAWLSELHTAIGKNKAVVLVSNSLAEAKAFLEIVKRDFPAKRVALYSSEMSPTEKSRHFADVHQYWSQLDVLIYTPTVSAGVSYELEHFDVLFGYFTDMSCDVETCRQMLGRVRNLRERTHYICLRGVPNNLPTSVEEIRRLVYDKRAGLYRQIDDAALQFEYMADGSIKYYESDYFYLWMETVRVENLSKNAFIDRFIDQVADTGAKIESLPDAPPSAGALLADHKRVKDDLKHAKFEAIASAGDITAEEAAAIREELNKQQQAGATAEVPDDRKLSYEKWQLRDVYAWHDRPVDAAFVENYSDDSAKRIYRNLQRITERGTIFESLQAIGERESIHYEYLMASRIEGKAFVTEGRDLQKDKRNYVFHSHFLAVWLLRLCGFICITDKTVIHEEVLAWRLRSAMPAIEKATPSISFEFGIRRPSMGRLRNENSTPRFLSGILAVINGVLRCMYGVEVRRVAKRSGGKSFFLNHTDVAKRFVFADEPEPDDAQGGPRPHIVSRLLPVDTNAGIARFIEDEYVDQDLSEDGGAPDVDEGIGCEDVSSGADGNQDYRSAKIPRPAVVSQVEQVRQMEQFLDAVFGATSGW